MASLQAVLVRALREELAENDPEQFADAVEQLVDATGAIQAAVTEELVRSRSRELESQAYTDALTGLGNLRHLQREIAHLLDLHKRYGHPFGLLLMDVDGLKRINDSHGHQAGDRVLMQVAMSVRRSIRSVDIAARIGGDEFCVLAPEQDAGERPEAGRAPQRRGGRGGGHARRPAGGPVDRSGVLPRARHGRRDADRRGGQGDVPRQGGRRRRGAGRAPAARRPKRRRPSALARARRRGSTSI